VHFYYPAPGTAFGWIFNSFKKQTPFDAHRFVSFLFFQRIHQCRDDEIRRRFLLRRTAAHATRCVDDNLCSWYADDARTSGSCRVGRSQDVFGAVQLKVTR
jgi:hypothetical protein